MQENTNERQKGGRKSLEQAATELQIRLEKEATRAKEQKHPLAKVLRKAARLLEDELEEDDDQDDGE